MSTPNTISPDAIRSQLTRILQSSGFVASPRLTRFLNHLVEQKLSGKAEDLKEYTVGLEVFDRPSAFDPKSDSIVRASARNLRAKLDEYYQNGGSSDPVVIFIPKGAYIPAFQARIQISRLGNWKTGTAAAVLVLGVLSLFGSPGKSHAHPSIAVVEVNNASGDAGDTWLSTALAEMLTEDLSANEGLKTVPCEQVAQWRRDASPGGPWIKDRLGVHYVVRADFHVTGRAGDGNPVVQVDTRLERVRDGAIVLQTSDRGRETQLYSLSARIAHQISPALGIRSGEPPVRQGPDRDSMRLYAEAVIKLRESDPLMARSLLEQSVRAEPSNFLARSLLAETYFSLGMEAQAKVEAEAGLALAAPLPPVERLALEARCQTAMRDFISATGSYQKLWRMFPESTEYGLNVADLQDQSGRDDKALQTLQALRKGRPAAADQARIDLMEALVRGRGGEYQKALVLVRRSEAAALRLGARYLYARARLREGGLLLNLVEPGALEALDDGLAICHELGYRSCEMNALRQEGNAYYSVNPGRALELYGKGVAIARQLGNCRGLVELLRGMGAAADRQMLDGVAEERYREVAQIVRDEKLSEKISGQVDLVELLIAEGRAEEATRSLRQMEPATERDFSWNLAMGKIERGRGQYDLAARRIQAQLAAVRKTDDRYALGLALEGDFWVHLDQGDFKHASEDADELNRIRAFDPTGAYLRAELALAQERWKEAQSAAMEADRRLRAEVNRPLGAAIALVRAEALTGAGHPAEGLRALDEIAQSLEQSRRKPLQMRARSCRLKAQALVGSYPTAKPYKTLMVAAHPEW